jgi:hypothetical protein
MSRSASRPQVSRCRQLIWLFVATTFLFSSATGLKAGLISSSFGQLDWFDANGMLHTQFSSWGRMDMEVAPDPINVQYLNVVGDAGFGSSWIIQNMPLFPASFSEPTRQSVDFNIVDIGLSAGMQLANMQAIINVGFTPLAMAPTGAPIAVAVSTLEQRATGGKLEPFPADVGQPAGYKAQGEPTKAIQHKGVPGVQEGELQCLPGSLARSISWLDMEHNLNLGKTAQQIFDDLVALKVGSQGPGATSYEEDIANKAKYLDDAAKKVGLRAVTKVLDLDNRLGMINGVREESGLDLIDWLYRELPTEDVELDYGHHIVTVTGIYMQGGMTFIKYRDDEVQGNNGAGDLAEKRGKLTFMNDMYFFRRDPEKGAPGDDFKVRVTISESIVPEPSSLALFAMGAVALVTYRWRRRNAAHEARTIVGDAS